MILTRVFPPEAMGVFFFATALTFLVLLFTTFGTHIHLVRAVARAPERGLDELGAVLGLRLPLTSLALLLLGGAVLAIAPALAPILVLASIFMLIGDFANSFGADMTGRRDFGLRFAVALAGPVALLVTVPLAVHLGATLEQTLLCYIGASTHRGQGPLWPDSIGLRPYAPAVSDRRLLAVRRARRPPGRAVQD